MKKGITELAKSLVWVGEQEGLNVISLLPKCPTSLHNNYLKTYCQIWIEGSLLPVGDKRRKYGVWFEGFKQFWDKDLDKVKENAIEQLIEKWKHNDGYEGHKKLYCSVCGEQSFTRDIGLVYGMHTCINCAKGMGEELKERGTQHI